MVDFQTTLVADFSVNPGGILEQTRVTVPFYVDHFQHQKAKMDGKAFTIFRARMKVKIEWKNKGFGAFGNDIAWSYMDARGTMQPIAHHQFDPFNEGTFEQEYDITSYFSPSNFGVNLARLLGVTHSFQLFKNDYRATLTFFVSYGV